MVVHQQSQRLVLYGWEKILKGECCLFVLNIILSIICGHAFISDLGYFVFKKNPKTLKIFKKEKIFYFVSSFIFLEDYMNYDHISLDLEHAWYCGET